jgi:hypothetical protein
MAANSHINLANVLEIEHDYAGAIDHHRRAAAILEATVGTGHPGYAIAILNICSVEHRRGRDREALAACARGLPLLEHAVGPRHPLVAQVLIETVCVVDAATGHVEDGLAALERGITLWRAEDPDRETSIAAGELALARAIWEASPAARRRARELAIRARDRYRDAGPSHDADRAAAAAWLAHPGGRDRGSR